MSDVPPPRGDLPEPELEPHEDGGLWHRYRSLPVGLQILAPLVVLAVIVGAIVWATSGSDGDLASSDTTDASGDTALEVVIKGIIVADRVTDSSVPTSDRPETTPEPTSPPTTVPPATTATTSSTSVATTSPVTTQPPDTTQPPATQPPDTQPPDTQPPDTEPPDSTEPTDTTDAPTTTAGETPALPSVAAFVDQWNDAATGTDVPTISRAQAQELTGDYAGYYLIPLTANGSTLPPQVGLVGTATAPGSGQLEEGMLVWIPGDDDDSSAFYWDCFGVLVQAISPGATSGEIAALASALGQASDTPPFTGTASASSGGLDYRAFTLPYTGEAGTFDVSAIEVS
jgi:hypothetical protein